MAGFALLIAYVIVFYGVHSAGRALVAEARLLQGQPSIATGIARALAARQ
jgi:hypothetical protein